MVDIERGYGIAIRNYLPESQEHSGVLSTHANELRREQCPITLCNNLRLYNTTNRTDYTEPYPYQNNDSPQEGTAEPEAEDAGQYRKKLRDRVAIDSHRRKGSYKWLDSFETN